MTTTRLPSLDRAILAAGVRWLLNTGQPDGAILQHHGEQRRGTDLTYSFCPIGPPHTPVVAVTNRTLNELSPELIKAVSIELARLGAPVSRQWTGGAQAMLWSSFGLAVPAHPSLVAAVDRYLAHCPKHQALFCGWQGRTADEQACTWYRDGNALVREPLWPVQRPDGRIYRPRKIVGYLLDDEFEVTGVLVTGTHDEQRAYRLARSILEDEIGPGVEPALPAVGWWRSGYENGRPTWITDDVRGAGRCPVLEIPGGQDQ